MALLSKKEFATACGFPTNMLSVYVKRKKVELSGESIDTSIDINADFLEKWRAKNAKVEETVSVLPPNKAKTPAKVTLDGEELGPNSTDDLLSRAKKYAELVQKETNNRIALLAEAKLKGELMPTDQVQAIVRTQSRSITTSYKNAAQLLIKKFAQKKQLTLEEQADLNRELIQGLNSAIDAATESAKVQIRKILKEVSQTEIKENAGAY